LKFYLDLKNRFKKFKPNLIGSRSVMDKHHATNDPAPDPLPGPTGILLLFGPLDIVRDN